MIKLAAIYNIFDGEENLISSIKSIRDNVDVIIAVQQQISNLGNLQKINLKKFLSDIKEIDIILDYFPDMFIEPGKNEFNKRIMGLKKAIEIGCTHYFHIDCDEEYEQCQFKNAFQKILEKDSDSSACRIVEYFKFKNLMIDDDTELYVPFIHKIQKGKMKLGMHNNYPVIVDKTRKGNPIDNFYCFKKEEIIMHHYSWVRDNIGEKINNSTARMMFEPIKKEIIKSYNKFEQHEKLIKIKNFITLPENILSYIDIKEHEYDYVKTRIIK